MRLLLMIIGIGLVIWGIANLLGGALIWGIVLVLLGLLVIPSGRYIRV